MPVEPGQTLSHYRLVEKIGAGAMGVVWKAEDTVLNRMVAIKVLPADSSRDDQRRQMFLQEAQLASQVSDAHIVQVHEFGHEGDLDYIVMEYIEGKPLNKLIHGRPLPPGKVAEIGLQVARALSRAHRKGLLHRDLKPANILVTPDGDVKVVDFGLAALFGELQSSVGSDEPTKSVTEDTQATRPHLVGTLPYMCPEQVLGKELDSRSDIFSLGVVLYEMTTGQRPFAGATSAELLQEICRSRPKPAHEVVPKLPLELDRIVEKTLARRRSNRYQSVDDLAVDLKRLARELESGSSPSYDDAVQGLRRRRPSRIALAVAALVVVAAAVTVWQLTTTRLDENSILVLPARVQGQDEGADYAGLAFAQSLAVNLAQVEELSLPPVPDGLAEDDGILLARKTGAGRILKTTVSRKEDVITTRVFLLDTGSNRIEWSTGVELEGGDLSRLAAEISRQTLAAIGLKLPRLYDYINNITGPPEMARSTELAQSLGALRNFEYQKAIKATSRLVEHFPAEPDALALRSYALLQRWFSNPSAKKRAALDLNLKNLQAEAGDSPYPAIFRGYIAYKDGNLAQSVEVYGEVLDRVDLTAQCRAWALRLRANLEIDRGNLKAAEDDLEDALALDPANQPTIESLSRLYRRNGRLEDAIARAKDALALEPNYWRSQQSAGLALQLSERYKEAISYLEKSAELNPSQLSFSLVASGWAQLSNTRETEAAIQRALAFPDNGAACVNLAQVFMMRDDQERVFEFLHRAVAAGFADVGQLEDNPEFEPLRGNLEFESIIAEVKKRHGEE